LLSVAGVMPKLRHRERLFQVKCEAGRQGRSPEKCSLFFWCRVGGVFGAHRICVMRLGRGLYLVRVGSEDSAHPTFAPPTYNSLAHAKKRGVR
jgi:hypothetical protein